MTVERRISQIFLRLLTDAEIIMLQSNFELSLRTSQKQENCIDVGPVIKHFLLHNKRYAFLIGTFTTHCRIALQCTVQSFVTLDSYYDRVYVNSLLLSHLVIFNQQLSALQHLSDFIHLICVCLCCFVRTLSQ